MTFAAMSTAAMLAGVAGLAALLYALQRLRTHYREVAVTTTMFWQQVVDEAPVRTFWQRFRHVWAYLLVLTICSLIWIGIAEPRFDREADRTLHVLVLDGSAGISAGRRFEDAVRQLETQIASLPRARRQVLWSGARTRTLLNPGEHEWLLSERLESLAPEAAPSSIERLLRRIAAMASTEEPISVLVFGEAPVRRTVLDLMPSTVSVRRAAPPASLERNTGITALGVANAASGGWDKVDVLIQVDGTTDRPPMSIDDIELDMDRQPIARAAIASPAEGRANAWLVRDLPANGGLFTAKIRDRDTLPLDDVARVRLPRKSMVNVLLSPSLASVIAPALRADPGVRLVTDAADVVIRRAGEPFGTEVPALELVGAATQAQAFLLTHPAAMDSTAVFNDAVHSIGLTQIDGMSLAHAAQRPIEAAIVAGRQWRFSMWEELLSDDFNFTQSRSFPLFMANAVRWLAGTPAWYPSVAAGQPLSTTEPGERRRALGAGGRVLNPLDVAFVPAAAGALRLDSLSEPLSVALLDHDVTTGGDSSALEVADNARSNEASQGVIAMWIVAIAVVLLGVEWYLFQTGRIP